MLVLTRRVGETIINDDIEVHILDVKGNQVRIDIKSSDEELIQQAEIYQQIYSEADKTIKPT